MTLPLLGSPLRVGPLVLRDRVVAAPMERNYADRGGRSTARYEAYLRARAAGGTALVFTDPAVSGLRPVAPSPVPFRGRTPREVTTGEAEATVTAFGAAAARCARAGVDALSEHGAHGYLVHQFPSPRTNHRTDRVRRPGRLPQRGPRRSPRRRVRPGTVPTAVRLRGCAGRARPGGHPGARLLRGGGVDVQPGEIARGVLASAASAFRTLGKPVRVAGRIPTGDAAEDSLRAGAADLVAVGRASPWPGTASC